MNTRIDRLRLLLKIAGNVLIVAGVGFLALTIALGGTINFALPLVFLMCGVAFYGLVFLFSQKWSWAALLFIPGSILLAFGLIFLLNVITGDWNSWAYAWLLLVAGVGLGMSLAGWYAEWRQEYLFAGIGLVILGITLFAVFGVIAGGPVIRVMAPLLLALGGLALRWLKPEKFLPERVLRWLDPTGRRWPLPARASITQQDGLVEPLSAREIEVLRLIAQGLSNQEIADSLTLAPSTVKTHINNMYGKLGVQTRVQALKRAGELGLLG